MEVRRRLLAPTSIIGGTPAPDHGVQTPNATGTLRRPPVKTVKISTTTLALLCAAVALVLAALIVVSLLAARHGRSPSADASSGPTFDGAVMPRGAKAPEFALRDQDGKLVRMSSFLGKPVIVTFLYTDCTSSCPAQAQQIKGALDDLGHDLPAVAVSVDPAHDTARKARHFLAVAGMGRRIDFVLGNERQLERVWKGYGIAPQRPGHEHQSWLTLVDRRGMQRVGYPGAEVTPERLAHDLRLLERE
jgi:protein SCO1